MLRDVFGQTVCPRHSTVFGLNIKRGRLLHQVIIGCKMPRIMIIFIGDKGNNHISYTTHRLHIE